MMNRISLLLLLGVLFPGNLLGEDLLLGRNDGIVVGFSHSLAAILGAFFIGLLWVRYATRRLMERNLWLESVVVARSQELRDLQEDLEAQSMTDALTGLYNRKFLKQRMMEDVAYVLRYHRRLKDGRPAHPLAENKDLIVYLLELSSLKEVNDAFGHAAGDELLFQTAQVIKNTLREFDTAVRWGSQQFLLVARNSDRRHASVLADRLVAAITNHPYHLGADRIIYRGCTLGFACFPFVVESPNLLGWEQVVSIAEHAHQAARQAGVNIWVQLEPSDQVPPEVFKHLPMELSRFVMNSQLVVHSNAPKPDELRWGSYSLADRMS